MAIDYHTLPQLPVIDMIKEPASVWLEVEHDILNGWSGRVKQMLQSDGENDGKWISGTPAPGWLTPRRAVHLAELDVPVLQFFWRRQLQRRIDKWTASKDQK